MVLPFQENAVILPDPPAGLTHSGQEATLLPWSLTATLAPYEVYKLEVPTASQPPPGGDGYTPSHEFVYKLARLADMLTTPTARRIAADRHRVMVEFFRRLDLEVAGEA